MVTTSNTINSPETNNNTGPIKPDEGVSSSGGSAYG